MHGRAHFTTVRGAEPSRWNEPTALSSLRDQIDRRLAELVAGSLIAPFSLNGAVRHALLAPGKRVRP